MAIFGWEAIAPRSGRGAMNLASAEGNGAVNLGRQVGNGWGTHGSRAHPA